MLHKSRVTQSSLCKVHTSTTIFSGEPKFDLRKETAFNVSLIYQSSGADDLARMCVDKYIVI